jgi:hypothetical protein
VNGTLGPEERGFVAGLTLLGLEKPAVDRALAGEGVARAWSEIRDLPRERRATALPELVRDVLSPLPPGVADLHPTWLREALAGEPDGLARALAQGTAVAGLVPDGDSWPLEPAVRRELLRLVLVPLEALAVEPAGPLGRELLALDEATLDLELCRRGARTVGTSLAGAPLELRARAMASAGAPWSVEIAGAAARPTEPAARERARRLVARAAALPALTPQHRLRAVGLLAVGGELIAEGAASALAVAGRLPVDLGRLLLGA